MKANRIKLFAIAIIILPLLAVMSFKTDSVKASLPIVAEDAAVTYKAKCVACHSPKAEKHFDLEKADADHVQVILKGKKGEKPPFMPGYETKGIDEEQAKALVAHMRELRKPSN